MADGASGRRVLYVGGMNDQPALTPEQLATVEEARERAAPIHRAARVAAFNAWTLGIFAVLTALFGPTSPLLLALAMGMGLVARNEWRGRALLRRFDPAGPELLVRNQIGLLVLAVAYCAWQLVSIRVNADPQWAVLQELLGLEPGYIEGLMTTGYVAAILVATLFIGLNARYYHRRGPMIAAWLATTPDWVVGLLRATEPG